jgi:ribosome maturation protein SDO1
MVDVDKAVVLRYSKKGHVFSILIDSEKAVDFRNGKVSLDDVIATDDIFTDVKKGIRASEHELKEVFGTNDSRKVAEIMIRDGELPVTTKQKSNALEEKRKQIINIIVRNGVDPKTGIPHPPQRIESSMEEAKVSIDEHKTAEEQVPEILKAITAIIPIKFEIKKLELVLPAKSAGQAYGLIKRMAKVIEDEWKNDGSLRVVIEIPVGIEDKFFTDINHICHGEVESKELK